MLRLAGRLRHFGNLARAIPVARKRQARPASDVFFTPTSYPLELPFIAQKYRNARASFAFGRRIRSPGANINYAVIRWGRGAVGSAPRWHRGGRGFESHRLHQKNLDCGGLAATFSDVAALRLVQYRGSKQQLCSLCAEISATRLLVTMFSSAPKKLFAAS